MARHWYITAAAVLALTLAAAGQQTPPAAGGAGGVASKVPAALSQELVLNIWELAPDGIAKTEGTAGNAQITMTAYLPDPAKSNGTAVIVCPGGAFRALSMQDEGSTVAKSLNEHGMTAFVLKYHLYTAGAGGAGAAGGARGAGAAAGGRGRGGGVGGLPRDLEIKNANANPEPGNAELANVVRLATSDGSQAIRLVRQNAAKWNINPNKIGIMGFSAGGGVAVGSVLIGDAESKPNFVATCYGPALVDVNVPADAPPLFIAVAADHQPVANGLLALYGVWKAAGKSAELHIYSNGRAGFGMRKQGLPSDTWIDRYYDWMKVQGFSQ